jgi:hypothetical protein
MHGSKSLTLDRVRAGMAIYDLGKKNHNPEGQTVQDFTISIVFDSQPRSSRHGLRS